VTTHVAQFDEVGENTAMLKRLGAALKAGERLTGADKNFYLHELKEPELMAEGFSPETAHLIALQERGQSAYSFYSPDVVQAFPETFNSNWLGFWGLSK